MSSPETHIVFLVSLSIPDPDYPDHHHPYGDLGIELLELVKAGRHLSF